MSFLPLTPLVELAATSSSTYERLGELQTPAAFAALLALTATWFFACLRQCFAQAIAARVLERAGSARRRAKLAPLLDRLASLTESASLFESACGLLFALLVLLVVAENRTLGFEAIAIALAVAVPSLWIASRGLAQAVSLRFGDAWVATLLPTFNLVQVPLSWLVFVFSALRRGFLRALGLRDDAEEKREIVAGLREVIADADVSGKLDETEREIIGNVMEFRDVDTAAVMTPRTEIAAIEVAESIREAARAATEAGRSRIPVYEGTLDTVIGTVSVKDLLRVLAEGRDATPLRSLLQPPYFVPETKRVSELLAEFRREKLGMAIVLDEYGGTAGLVTLRDVLAELIGEMPGEDHEDEELPVRFLPGGIAEVDAATNVSEVNKVLDLELPETADYQTLAGFVLAEFGRFPERGESFVRGDREFQVVEANDRRVYRVRVKRLAAAG
ncbi:MAG: HlyC/CorC family transporter [Planctomycetes bacterium]|nr:HlyC/CorC family transporter [Planctomycetota bacterium]